MIYGVLSISNGVSLNYPFPVVMANLSSLCDKVIIGVDPQFPNDAPYAKEYIKLHNLTNVSVVPSRWNRHNIKDGNEIAIQMEILVGAARLHGASWVVVPQADELFLNADFPILRDAMLNAPLNVIGFSTERLYFWKDFNIIRKDWNAKLVRIFRPDSFSFMTSGTDKAGMYSAPILEGITVSLQQKMYHYSRVGSEKEISRRVRNLDTFFHPEDELVSIDNLPDYDFKPREFDNYSIVNTPPAVEGEFYQYNGPHPDGIKEWFGVK